MEASGTCKKLKQRQTAIILHCAGPQVLDVYDHFHFEQEDDKNDTSKTLEKLDEYCNPRDNEVLHSFRFWNQGLGESKLPVSFEVPPTALYYRKLPFVL